MNLFLHLKLNTMKTLKKETKPMVGFNPRNLKKMYEAYLKHSSGKEIILIAHN